MDLKRLQTFVTIAEQGGISAAAAASLRITQPALSRRLQELQAEFGVPLFDQVGRRLRLTAEGTELLPLCRSLLNKADDLLAHARSLSQGDSGVLRVGATAHIIANFFPGFLRQFAAVYPRVQVEAVEAGGVDQLDLIRRGELHAAITFAVPGHAGLVNHALPPLTFLAVYDARRFPSLGTTVEVRDLADLPLLLLRPSFGARKEFDAACRLERVTPRVFLESAAPETLQAMARAGHGIAVISTTARIDQDTLRITPITFRGKLFSVDIAVLWDAQRRLPRYAEAFSATLAAHMRAVMPQLEQAQTARPRRRKPA